MSQTNLGEMLRLYRFVHKLTVRDFAKVLGISAATISRMERGGECDVETFLKVLIWMRKEPSDAQ